MPADAHRVLSPRSEKGAAETQSKEPRSREGCRRGTAVTAQREGVAITVSSGARGTRDGGPGPTVRPGRSLEEVGAELHLEDRGEENKQVVEGQVLM